MIKTVKNLFSQITDSTQDYRIRLFYVLALGGIAISLLTLVISAVTSMWGTAAISLVLIIISAALIWLTYKTGRYQLAYVITVVLVFMIFFPIMFFTSGGHKSGMPLVFMFAMLFTILKMTK